MSEYDWNVEALYEIAMNNKILFHGDRRIGKTEFCYKYISSILTNHDVNIVYVTTNRSSKVLSDIVHIDESNNGGILRVHTYTLTTKNNTKLVISSPTGSFFRGMHVDYLIMDDFDLYNINTIKDVLPYLTSTSKIIGFSGNENTETFDYLFNENPLNCTTIRL